MKQQSCGLRERVKKIVAVLKPMQSFNKKARQQRGGTGRVPQQGVILILTISKEATQIKSLPQTRNNIEPREISQGHSENRVARKLQLVIQVTVNHDFI